MRRKKKQETGKKNEYLAPRVRGVWGVHNALHSISDGTKKGREAWLKNEKKKEAGDGQGK